MEKLISSKVKDVHQMFYVLHLSVFLKGFYHSVLSMTSVGSVLWDEDSRRNFRNSLEETSRTVLKNLLEQS